VGGGGGGGAGIIVPAGGGHRGSCCGTHPGARFWGEKKSGGGGGGNNLGSMLACQPRGRIGGGEQKFAPTLGEGQPKRTDQISRGGNMGALLDGLIEREKISGNQKRGAPKRECTRGGGGGQRGAPPPAIVSVGGEPRPGFERLKFFPHGGTGAPKYPSPFHRNFRETGGGGRRDGRGNSHFGPQGSQTQSGGNKGESKGLGNKGGPGGTAGNKNSGTIFSGWSGVKIFPRALQRGRAPPLPVWGGNFFLFFDSTVDSSTKGEEGTTKGFGESAGTDRKGTSPPRL